MNYFKMYYFSKKYPLTPQIIDYVLCKRPTMTKTYKSLKAQFNSGLISGFGYSKIESENTILALKQIDNK